ncbi:MAG: YXWGXW repeat-containing protein [Verrucomicrobiota bacterium]
MKRHTLVLSVASLAVLLSGCVNPDGSQNNTGSGALIGGAFGALTGAAIGGRHHGGQDALIGAAAGALAGGLIGNAADREQAARLRAQAPQTYTRVDQGAPLSIADVKALAKAGISEDVIINQIHNSRTIFHLSAADIIDLRDAGVSNKVVNYMIDTPASVGANTAITSTVVVQQAPPPLPVETVVVAPGPGYVWIGGEWIWSGGWVWRAGYWGCPPRGFTVWVGGRTWHDGRHWHCERGHWR